MAATTEFGIERRKLSLWRSATAIAVLLTGVTVAGCYGKKTFAPLMLSNPNERHPIAVRQGEATLDLAVDPGAYGLSHTQKAQLQAFLADYRKQRAQGLLIRAPANSPNEVAARRAFDDVRRELRKAGFHPDGIAVEPYFAEGDPYAPLRISYLRYFAQGPECGDWSHNLAWDPQNLPWRNMGCATQRNLAAMVTEPRDLLMARSETPRSSERRDVVWGKYIEGEVTGAKRGPDNKPLSERTATSEVSGGGQ